MVYKQLGRYYIGIQYARVDPPTPPISREIGTKDAREIRPEVAHIIIIIII